MSAQMQTEQDPTVVLERWERARGFGPAAYGRAEWWLAPVRASGKFTSCGHEIPITASGREVIEIMDVANGIVVYRQYVLDPDGNPCTFGVAQRDWLLEMSVSDLRGAVQRMGMRMTYSLSAQQAAFAPEPFPTEPQAKAQIIAFPADRIVRVVKHGSPVVEAKWPTPQEVEALADRAGIDVAWL